MKNSTNPHLSEPPRKLGIHIKPDFNTSMPNYLLNPKYWSPGSGGRAPSAYAPLLYMLLLDKVTSVVDVDEVKYGLVLNAKPISFKDLAESLGISYRSVGRNLQHLVDVGLIERYRSSYVQEYSYSVPNCR
jgi:DNA-binding transcriptional ArsR family regulator